MVTITTTTTFAIAIVAEPGGLAHLKTIVIVAEPGGLAPLTTIVIVVERGGMAPLTTIAIIAEPEDLAHLTTIAIIAEPEDLAHLTTIAIIAERPCADRPTAQVAQRTPCGCLRPRAPACKPASHSAYYWSLAWLHSFRTSARAASRDAFRSVDGHASYALDVASLASMSGKIVLMFSTNQSGSGLFAAPSTANASSLCCCWLGASSAKPLYCDCNYRPYRY
jgi:hypothetical protein